MKKKVVDAEMTSVLDKFRLVRVMGFVLGTVTSAFLFGFAAGSLFVSGRVIWSILLLIVIPLITWLFAYNLRTLFGGGDDGG